MLKMQQLHFDYPSQGLSLNNGSLLTHISWALSAGEILHIHGANGSGKTTLLKLLAGLMRPDSGSILYDEQDIWSDIALYQHQLCYLGHKNGISPALTAIEHCQFDLHATASQDKTTKIVQQLGLWPVRVVPCHLLSAGQKRRVAFIRLLLSPAKLWLLDEPLVALDEAGVAFLMSLLQDHLASGGQVVYTSHQALPWVHATHRAYCL